MQRTDNRNIQRGKFFQKCLYLHTIFPANVDIIPPGLTGPVFRSIPCPEFTKPICTEHNLFRLLICDNDLRPVHHGRCIKLQGMLPQFQSIPFLDYNHPAFQIHFKKLLHHIESRRTGYNLHIRKSVCQILDTTRMIRLHMLNNQIIQSSSIQSLFQTGKPVICHMSVHRIHNSRFFIQNYIRIICHTMFHCILTFKQSEFTVIHPYIDNLFRYMFHGILLL